jgi:hypothetical protein
MSDDPKRLGRPKGSKNRQPKGALIKIRDLTPENPLASYLDDVKSVQGLATRSAAGQLVLDHARQQRLFLSSGTDTSIASE